MQNHATIKGVDAATVRTWLDRGEAVLVDIREDREVAEECIPEAHQVALSAFDPAHLPTHDGRIVVYHCASGGRTANYGAELVAAASAARDVYHLEGGIMAWRNAGFRTRPGRIVELPRAMPNPGALCAPCMPCAPA